VEKVSCSMGLILAQPFSSAQNQFRCADFPIVGRNRDTQSRRQAVQIFVLILWFRRNDDLRFASSLRSWRKIPIHHKVAQSRDAAPARCRVRSELGLPRRSQVEWHMAFAQADRLTRLQSTYQGWCAKGIRGSASLDNNHLRKSRL
jgi:hypothetical protein